MSGMVPELETERLRLRAFRQSDLATFADYCADERAMRFLGGPVDADTAWRRLAMLAGHWMLLGCGPFAIEEKSSPGFIGYAGPWFPNGWPEPEIMWGLITRAHGKGYATEAAAAARAWAYRTFGWTTAISLIDPDNHASRRVAERLGAWPDGTTALNGQAVNIHRHPSPIP